MRRKGRRTFGPSEQTREHALDGSPCRAAREMSWGLAAAVASAVAVAAASGAELLRLRRPSTADRWEVRRFGGIVLEH
jgi:hypothetical protein